MIWPDPKVTMVLIYSLLSCLLVFAHVSPLPKMSFFLPLHISKSLLIFQVTVYNILLSLKIFLTGNCLSSELILYYLLSFASPPYIVAIYCTCLTSPSDHTATLLLYLFNRSGLRGKFFVSVQLHVYIFVNCTTFPLCCRIQ